MSAIKPASSVCQISYSPPIEPLNQLTAVCLANLSLQTCAFSPQKKLNRKCSYNAKKVSSKTRKSVDERDGQGNTPMYHAIKRGDAQAVATLVSKGASLTAPVHYREHEQAYDWPTFTPLQWAVAKGQISCVDELAKSPEIDFLEEPVQDIGNLLQIALHFKQNDMYDHLLETYPGPSVKLIEQGLGSCSLTHKWFLVMQFFDQEWPIPREWLMHWLKEREKLSRESRKSIALLIPHILSDWRLIKYESKHFYPSGSKAIYKLTTEKLYQDQDLAKQIWLEAYGLMKHLESKYINLPTGGAKHSAIWLPHAWALAERGKSIQGIHLECGKLWQKIGENKLIALEQENAFKAFSHAVIEFSKLQVNAKYGQLMGAAYQGMGTAALELARYSEAQALLRQAYELQSVLYASEESEELAWEFAKTCAIRGRLSRDLYEQDRTDMAAQNNAEFYFNKALSIGRAHQKTHLQLAETLTDYAFFLHFKKEFSKAIDMHKEALEMLKAIFSTELHIKVIQSYNNLAISLHDATREAIKSEQPPDILFNQATEYYEKALLLARALQKQEHFEWSLLINYGSLLTDFGLPYEGYQKYQAAIAMKNRISVNPHRNPADLFFNCAVELKHIGLYEEASFLLSEAFEIFKKLYGMASPDAKRTSDQLKEIKSFAKLRT